MGHSWRISLLLCFCSYWQLQESKAQQTTFITGSVIDAIDGEPIIGATVRIASTETVKASDDAGNFVFLLPEGDYTLQSSHIAYVASETVLTVDSSYSSIIIYMQPAFRELEQVIITDVLDPFRDDEMPGKEKLSIQQIKDLPTFLGEVDVLRSLQLLPGVQTTGDGQTGLHVRGGSNDQNLILWDGASVYNPSHLLGFFSVFNPASVSDITLYKGGIPARYGGRLSSLLKVESVNPQPDRPGIQGSVGNVSTQLAGEAALGENGGIHFGARRTYADMFLKLSSDPGIRDNTLFFYDVNATAHYQLTEKDQLKASLYMGNDQLGIDNLFKLNYGNKLGSFQWNRTINKRLKMQNHFSVSQYTYAFELDESIPFRWDSGINERRLSSTLFYTLSDSSYIIGGIEGVYYNFLPANLESLGNNSFSPFTGEAKQSAEHALFIENVYRINKFSMRYGLRYSIYHQYGPGSINAYEDDSWQRIENTVDYNSGEIMQFYHGLEPRALVGYNFSADKKLQFSYHRMRQHLQVASNAGASLPIDRWIPSDRFVKPIIADQWSLSFTRFLKGFEFNTQAYFKYARNILDFKTDANVFLVDNIESQLLEGHGRAYGIEFLAKKNFGQWTGWFSYTLSRTERIIEGINLNNPYPAKYDRTHDLSLVLSYPFNERISISGNFVYATGLAVSFPAGRYVADRKTVTYFDDTRRNAQRMPDYHRLDLALKLYPKNYENKRFKHHWAFSVYNAYARKNAFSIFFETNDVSEFHRFSSGEVIQKTRPLSPVKIYLFTIIPSVSYNFRF